MSERWKELKVEDLKKFFDDDGLYTYEESGCNYMIDTLRPEYVYRRKGVILLSYWVGDDPREGTGRNCDFCMVKTSGRFYKIIPNEWFNTEEQAIDILKKYKLYIK